MTLDTFFYAKSASVKSGPIVGPRAWAGGETAVNMKALRLLESITGLSANPWLCYYSLLLFFL